MIVPKYYEDPHTFSVNACPLRSYYIPTSAKQSLSWQNRRETDRFFLLNGEWKFRYFSSIYDCTEEFFAQGYDTTAFDTLPVPSNWQDHGYDRHQYSNTRFVFPFDPPYVPHENPCGAYVKTFVYGKPEKTESVFLNFEGVDSCYYVWLNGVFVGYQQVAHATGEFDVSALLIEGENTLAVLVLKWCDGSYLEDQDKYRSSGIFRDVYLLARPRNHIRDYFVHTALSEDYTGARVQVQLALVGENQPVSWQLLDCQGEQVSEGEFLGEESVLSAEISATSPAITFFVENVQLWNAEQPCLYTLILRTADEVIRERIGFREVYTRDAVLYLNGQKLRFRGVNRHDSDPYVGSAVTVAHIRRDMALMKQHNFNAIRTSHYPNAPEFYQLCDEYGFYLINEADLEIHGVENLFDLDRTGFEAEYPFATFLCDNPEWTEAVVDRAKRLVIRDKNRPSVLIWSMGNEAGYGAPFEASLAWTKSYDPDRLAQYESSLHHPNHPISGKNDYRNIDFRSRMYPPIPEVKEYLDNGPDKPFLLCEYVHAMGNGPGDLEDYYALEEEYDTYAGGFVWEWCDHSVYLGITPEGRQKFGYGGDCGEYPHDGNFCVDGLVYPDRRPSPSIREYKNVHRPVRIFAVDVHKGEYILSNKLDFWNLKDFLYLTYELSEDGRVVATGEIGQEDLLDVPPRSSRQVTLPIALPEVSGKRSLRILSHLKEADAFREAGFILGFDQVYVEEKPTTTLQTLLAERATGRPIKVTEDDRFIYLGGEEFSYVYNKLTGAMARMVYKNQSFLEGEMEYNLWRAPTDNDRIVKELWLEAGYDVVQSRSYSNAIKTLEDGSVEITTTSSLAPVWRQKYLEVESVWTIRPDGGISVWFEMERNAVMRGKYAEFFYQNHEVYTSTGLENENIIREAYLPRLGLRLRLPGEMNQAEYFGFGPEESYVDKRRASYQGCFCARVEDMHEDYLRPQENGSHYDCEYVQVAGRSCRLSVYHETPFSFNLSEYTQEELTGKAHNYELEKSGQTILCIDYRQSGIGSGSCGPQLHRRYRLNDTHYAFGFRMKPEVW